MVALITDPELQEQLITERQAAGADKFDEVWEGVYVMAPMANNEHQELVKELTTVLTIAVDWTGLGKVYPGVNITDQVEDWKFNYRCPDVVVFLKTTQAENRGTHWYGGPDLAIEIVSPNDRSLEKRPFYANIGTRELMLIQRNPWVIILYRRRENELVEVERSTLDNQHTLTSNVVPLNWRLVAYRDQPAIEIMHHDGQQRWSIAPGVD